MDNEYQNHDLTKIFQIYNLSDLVIAAFCLLSWRDNRSIIKTALTINQALIEHDGNGTRKIESYNDFHELYISLKELFPISSMDDLTINDFGEIKIRYKDEVYPLIIGNGYEQTYEVMHFLIRTAQKIDKEIFLEETLQYSKKMIDSLKEYNVSVYDESELCFDLPTENYFNIIRNYFKALNLTEYSQEFIHNLSTKNFPIEKAHFFYKEEKIYPLFNASLFIDVYSYIINNIDKKEIAEIVQETLWNTLHNNFDMYSTQNPQVLYPAQIVNKIIKDQIYFTFIAPINNGLIIAFNIDLFPEDILKRDLKRLKKYHKKGKLVISEIRSRDHDSNIAIRVPVDWELHFIGYDNFTDITKYKSQAFDALPYTYMTALDLLLILNDIESFLEFQNFIKFINNKQPDRIFSLSGMAGLYILYKEMHGLISEGAIDFNMLSVSYDFPSRHIYDLFTKDYKNYPFGIKSSMFKNIHHWKVQAADFGFNIYLDKSEHSFFGYGRKIGEKGFIILTHNSDFTKKIKIQDDFFEYIKTIDELNQRFFERYSHLFETMNPFNNACVQFLYMPFEYACQIDRSGFTKNPEVKYVYAEYNASYPEHIVVRYTVKADKLVHDIMEAKNREVENEYFLELLQPLGVFMGKNKLFLDEQCKKDANRKKTVNLFQMRIKYKYNPNVSHSMPKPYSFKKVRKNIAIICHDKNIESGVYQEQAARDIVRRMQIELVKVFEQEISQYAQFELHKIALDHLAELGHENEIMRSRYVNFADLDHEILVGFQNETLNIREKIKRNIRAVQYLIESNLFVARKSEVKAIDKLIYDYLLAFADWLLVLQDNSDMAHFGFAGIGFEVTSQYNINVIIDDHQVKKISDINKRRYDFPDYTIKNDEIDSQYLMKAVDALEKDLDFPIALFFDILRCLRWNFLEGNHFTYAMANVVIVSKKEVIHFISNVYQDVSKETVQKVLDYLTLNTHELKICNGKVHEILPIWEREKRSNRFDQKPLLSMGENYIYSPVIIHVLFQAWRNGIPDFYPPYEIGLDNTLVILEEWKERYEGLMVWDLAEIFKKLGLTKVFPNLKLHRIDKDGSYPDYLGDYDLLVIDDTTDVIWNLESKVLKKVGSIFEESMQQKGFFERHKFDEKFQRRIDYLRNNYKVILKSLEIDNSKEYAVRSYMVTNKIFTCRVKQIGFPILSFNEMKKLTEDYYGNRQL